MATLSSLSVSPVTGGDGNLALLKRLVLLGMELRLAERREPLVGVILTRTLAPRAVLCLIAALVAMLAATLAPLVAALWAHLRIAAAGILMPAALTLSAACPAFARSIGRVAPARRSRTNRWLDRQLRFGLRWA